MGDRTVKTAVVTGAAGGMGKAICRTLLEAGFRVCGLDLREVGLSGVRSIRCDLTDLDSLEAAREEIAAWTDSIDCIIHAAGIYDLDALSEMEDRRFQKIFEINVFAVARINRLLLPAMQAGGRVTIITSELAPLNPLPFTGIYSVTKAALDKYAYSLRNELALRGIFVTVIRPGAVNTGLLDVSTKALDRFCEHTRYFAPNAKHFRQIVNAVEARSIPPEQIAALVLKSLTKKHPRYVYSRNRNPLLRLMSALPDRMQTQILKLILR